MTAGLTAQGFTVKTVDELLTQFQTEQRASVDDQLNNSASGLLANLNAVQALAFAELWEQLQVVYDSRDPSGARGVALDAIGELRGVPRLGATASTVVLQLELEPDGRVEAGSVVSQLGDPTVRFSTLTLAANAGSATAVFDVMAVCEDKGATAVGAGTLTVIESRASGWLSVTNANPAVQGTAVEKDSPYLARQVKELSRPGSSTVAGIESDIRDIDGVSSVRVLENESDDVVDGIPPHAIEAVVLGGDDAAVAQAILVGGKAAGIGTTGNTSVTVQDANGNDKTIRFTRPVVVPIYARWAGEYDSSYDATPLNPGIWQQLSKATTDPDDPAYMGVGVPVRIARIIEVAMDAQGVTNLTINAGTTPPASSSPSAVNAVIAITQRQLPQLTAFVVDA